MVNYIPNPSPAITPAQWEYSQTTTETKWYPGVYYSPPDKEECKKISEDKDHVPFYRGLKKYKTILRGGNQR